MPEVSLRIMPARNSNWWEMVSASAGTSFRVEAASWNSACKAPYRLSQGFSSRCQNTVVCTPHPVVVLNSE